MNIEGAVKLGYRKELMAIDDPEARLAEFQRRTATAYDRAKAVNASPRPAGPSTAAVTERARNSRQE